MALIRPFVPARDLARARLFYAALAPERQVWGIRVGFLYDPSGVLWHVAERPPP